MRKVGSCYKLEPESLNFIFECNKDTRKFYWKFRWPDRNYNFKFNNRWANKEAFTSIDRSGYAQTSAIIAKRINGHYGAWVMTNGKIPEDMEIDHINRDRSDNKIENLRLVDRSINLRNTCIRKDNTSGFRGVSLDKRSNRWISYVNDLDQKRIVIGYYDTAEIANEQRLKYEKDYDLKYERI